MKIFVTKYALTKGIMELEAVNTMTSSCIRVVSGGYDAYYHDGDYTLSRAAAVAEAEIMRDKEIHRLTNKIAKLVNMKF